MSEASPLHDYDRRGLIREAYRIEGITASQCRSIFLDWVLGAAQTPPLEEQIAALLAFHGAEDGAHPMNEVLRAGLEGAGRPGGRRGGWRGRRAR